MVAREGPRASEDKRLRGGQRVRGPEGARGVRTRGSTCEGANAKGDEYTFVGTDDACSVHVLIAGMRVIAKVWRRNTSNKSLRNRWGGS